LPCGWNAGEFAQLRAVDRDSEIECLLVRAQEMARYVELAHSTPASPSRLVVETGAAVENCRAGVRQAAACPRPLVLAVPEDSPVRHARDSRASDRYEVVRITKIPGTPWVTSRVSFPGGHR